MLIHYVSASVGGRSGPGNCPGSPGSLDSGSIHLSMYVITCMHDLNAVSESAPPLSCRLGNSVEVTALQIGSIQRALQWCRGEGGGEAAGRENGPNILV